MPLSKQEKIINTEKNVVAYFLYALKLYQFLTQPLK